MDDQSSKPASATLGCSEQPEQPFRSYHKVGFDTMAYKALHAPYFLATIDNWAMREYGAAWNENSNMAIADRKLLDSISRMPFIDSAERPHQRDGRVDHTGYRPQPAHALPGVEFFPPSSALYLTVRNFVMSRELRQLTAIPYPIVCIRPSCWSDPAEMFF